jgi:hypothetical protein
MLDNQTGEGLKEYYTFSLAATHRIISYKQAPKGLLIFKHSISHPKN